MRRAKYFYFGSLLLAFLNCNPYSNEINDVLRQANSNGEQLESVIKHYEKDTDPMKLKAAYFLIGNMGGHYSFDTSNLAKYRPSLFSLRKYVAYKQKNPDFPLNETMDSLWRRRKDSIAFTNRSISKARVRDIDVVTSDYLIEDMEKAFYSWRQSKYSKSVPFYNFCEYILPYRPQIGIALQEWRSSFFSRHFKAVNELYPASMKTVVDTLLSQYKDYSHTFTIMPDYPYYKLQDFEISKRGGCETKCWFNTMLFASVGIPVAIDYVPAWGNRNGSHQWNALVIGKDSHPFEPFWEENKWKYKKLYDNKSSHKSYGDYRLPKVFRYSYSTNTELAELERTMQRSDIPTFFSNTKLKDVSSTYFRTTDVKVRLKNVPEGASYAFLCVFSSGSWKPINWGKINGREVTFKAMGRDIVYLPVYYKNGESVPASKAFYLTPEGKINEFNSSRAGITVKINRKYPLFPIRDEWPVSLVGGKIQGANRSDFKDAVDMHIIKNKPNPIPTTIKIKSSKKYRYVRFLYDSHKGGNMAELRFYSARKGQAVKLTGTPIFSSNISIGMAQRAFDGNLNTFTFPPKDVDGSWIGLDFKHPQVISSVDFCPRNDGNNIYPGIRYELFYWDDKWKSLGVQASKSYELVWNNAPSNTFFLLKADDGGKEERIFCYESNRQLWR